MLFFGSFRSPDRLTPAISPVTAGKKTANTCQKSAPPFPPCHRCRVSDARAAVPENSEASARPMSTRTGICSLSARSVLRPATAATRTMTAAAVARIGISGQNSCRLSTSPKA